MSIRYGQKVSNLADKQVSSAFNSFNRTIKPKISFPFSKNAPYSRPNDYLSVPTITSSEQKIALLVFISNDDSNFLAFTISGAYTVDWGDGTTQNYSSGSIASKIYNYTTYDPTNTTLNSEGFKQALVVITPQGGSNLTSLNFQTRHPSANVNNSYSQPIAELYISCPNLTSLTLGTASPTTTVYPRFAKYLNLINVGNVTSLTNSVRSMYELLKVDIGKTSALLTSTSNMFQDCYSLQIVTINNETDTSSVTTMSIMFFNCHFLVTIPLFNTSNVTNMQSMFGNCYSLTTVPLFNTSNVTNMQSMFGSCYSLTIVPLFNTSNVTNMQSMFGSCYSLIIVPLFNTSNVTNMQQMFSTCFALITVPLFNTAKVTNMQSMFGNCYSLTTVPLFNTANVNDMSNMFIQCFSIITVPLFNTINVTTMANMFNNCRSLITTPLLNTASVTNMANMFQDCYSLTNTPLFNTVNVTSMASMFQGCRILTTVPLFNTINVTTMAGMFLDCRELTTIPLFNTANVTTMQSMFSNCYVLVSVPLFNTAAVATMQSMFNNCFALTSVPLFNTGNVTNMQTMFQFCSVLTSVPLFNTTNVTNMSGMFNGCSNLNNISTLNVFNVVDFTSAFTNNFSLATVGLSGIRVSASLQSCKLSQTSLQTLFNNLGTALSGATRTILITDNWGAPTPVSLTGTTTAGSTTITMANTTGLSAGMQVTGVNTPLTTGRSVTFTDAGDTVDLNSHGLSNGDEVSFSVINNTTGININTIYFVVNRATNTFQVASTLGGSALPLTTNGTGTLRYNSTIVSIVPNTSITMSRPMAGSGTQSLAFRQLATYRALLKGFAITG